MIDEDDLVGMNDVASDGFENLAGLQDSYDQIQKIAIGGMAEIYRGRQKNLDRAVAIKRIKPDLKSHRQIRQRFVREAKSSAVFIHQNLAHVYDFRKVENDLYIIMEYIDGFDLAEIIETAQKLPFDVATMIAVSVLRGLAHVHAHGMVHRDIKPDNIRLSVRGSVKIMDFGIAYDPGETQLTRPGILIGSPHYLAPEQIIGEKPTPSSDIFSFGVTYYEMLTGRRPFVESDDESVYVKIQKGKYISPEELNPEIPQFVVSLLQSCLQVKRSQRPQSALRVATSLEEYLSRYNTLDFAPRLRQFLMKSEMLPGNPSLIEIEEVTLIGDEAPLKRNRLEKLFLNEDKGLSSKKAYGFLFGLLILFLFSGYFIVSKLGSSKKNVGPIPVEKEIKDSKKKSRKTKR